MIFSGSYICAGQYCSLLFAGCEDTGFHGYAAEKKDHWVIRRYFDTYFTQGPFFTKKFKELAAEYKDFEVVETGWPKQDWIKIIGMILTGNVKNC